jgi:hypothetical protein
MKSFEYTSVHQYLDCVLQNNPNASHNQIKEAKKAYWKLYYSHYRKQKRKKRKEFTLGFYNEQLDKIDIKRGELTVSKFFCCRVFEFTTKHHMQSLCHSIAFIYKYASKKFITVYWIYPRSLLTSIELPAIIPFILEASEL